MTHYQNKVALITGGSSGIGLALAEQLVEAGAHVWIMARTAERLQAASAQLEAKKVFPGQCIGAIQADVCNYDQVNHVIAKLEEQAGAIDFLINSAGVTHPGYFEMIDIEIFREMIDINYLGTVNTTKAVISGMIKRRSGHIINIGSLAGVLGVFGYSAYGASKFAVRGFTDALRLEMIPYGVKVSLVLPPDTDTPQLAYDHQLMPDELRVVFGKPTIVQPEIVADAVIKGVQRGKYLIFPDNETKFIWFLIKTLGELQYPILDFLFANAKQKIAKTKANGHTI